MLPMMHQRGGNSETLGAMCEEGFRNGAEVNRIMTLITKRESVVDSGGEIQMQECVEDSTGGGQDTAGGQEDTHSLCVSEVQLQTAAESPDMSPNTLDIRPESGKGEESNRNTDSTVDPDSQQDKSFVPGQTTGQQKSDCSQVSARHPACDDDEIVRRAREEGRVDVVFPGSVTPDGCYRFVCELLKCVLYQRQQLPMTYDQMVSFLKQQPATTQIEEGAVRKPIKPSGDSTWQRCQRTLQELDEVLGHLEVLFSLSYVPRVLFMLGKSGIVPRELYEVNMEDLAQGGSDKSLRTSLCLRQMFRTLFVADLLSDVNPVRLMNTTVMALAHRDCGVGWFKPKVDFRFPSRVKRQVISLASGPSGNGQTKADTTDWDDYIWFQTPVAIKGFCT